MSTIRVAQIPAPGEPIELVERPTPEPGRGQVRIAIEACGVCHTDALFASGHFPGVSFPLVAGHEIAGRIDAIGEGAPVGDHAPAWRVGDRVAVGWFGGSCRYCDSCRAGDFISCDSLQVPAVAYPGGFADAVVVPFDALARIPDGLSAAQAAPLGCAGVTTFKGLRESGARAGDVVAIVGLGGLGHLAVQYAARMGFETVAIARGAEKAQLARDLGAHHTIDSTEQDVSAELQALGGARAVIATAASSEAMVSALDGLAKNGQLTVIGATPEPMPISPFQLIGASRRVVGHPSGTSFDVEQTMRFTALAGIEPMIETVPLEQAQSAFERMLSGEARFRMVLVTGR
ncbi:MAG TPA: alcohol dehydrogenase [Gaiellales bacterium]|jgi:alcohol dehydrogenase